MKTAINTSAKTKKQGGFIMTTELVLLVTTMVVGMIVGLVTMRDSVVAEMEDVAEAVGALDQSYAYNGLRESNSGSAVSGSQFLDNQDLNAGDAASFTFVSSDGIEGTTGTAAPTGAYSTDVAPAVPNL